MDIGTPGNPFILMTPRKRLEHNLHIIIPLTVVNISARESSMRLKRSSYLYCLNAY